METLREPHEYDVDLEAANCRSGSGDVSTGNDGGAPPLASDEKGFVEKSSSNEDRERRVESSVAECTVVIVDLGSGVPETKGCLAKIERDCRICHLSLEPPNQDSGVPIELGCSCKDDLAIAHKQCAEAWFKIRGNKTCEICGSIAHNVSGVPETDSADHSNESNDDVTTPAPLTLSRRFWQRHRFLNLLLACVVFAFVISWLFHFNVPS